MIKSILVEQIKDTGHEVLTLNATIYAEEIHFSVSAVKNGQQTFLEENCAVNFADFIQLYKLIGLKCGTFNVQEIGNVQFQFFK